MRHDCANQMGETRDESGHLHLAHKACGAIMELTYALRGITADESTWPANRTIPVGRPSKCMNEAKQARQPFAVEAKTACFHPTKDLENLEEQLRELRQSKSKRLWTVEDNRNEAVLMHAIMCEYERLCTNATEGNYSTKSNRSEKAKQARQSRDYAAIFNSPVWNDFRFACLAYSENDISREELNSYIDVVESVYPDYRELAEIEAEGNYSTESNSSEKASDGQGLPPL